MRKLNCFLLALLATFSSFAQDMQRPVKVMESFEDGIPAGLSAWGGKLSIDTLRMKHGKNSLRWDWVGNDRLTFNTPVGYHKARNLANVKPVGRDQYLMDGHSSYDNKVVLEEPRGFAMWIYNEKASSQRLTFQFGRGDIVDCDFDFYLDFVGWRNVAVIYDRGDMRGVPRDDMDRMTILAPATSTGTYYIDAMGLSLPMNAKVVTANPQLPYLQPHTRIVSNYEHRLYEYSKFQPSIQLEEITPAMNKALAEMNKKAEEFIIPSYDREKFKNKSINGVIQLYNKFEIKRDGDKIYGRPLIKGNALSEFFREAGLGKDINKGCMEWRNHFGKALIDIAMLYNTSNNEDDKAKLEEMFINLFDYGIDQGFDVGAGVAWIHHYAYEIREVGPAFFLMRDVLEKRDRLDKAVAILKWFHGYGQVYRNDLVYNCKGRVASDADATQGLLIPRLYTALIQKNTPEKVRDLRHFTSHFSEIVANYASALDEVYKPDGTIFHHAGHSMGYGGRGIHGGVATLYLLSHSPFKATPQAYQRMKKLTSTFFDCLNNEDYSSTRAFASIRFSSYQLPKQFLYMPALLALSADNFDAEMAGFYKQLVNKEKDLSPQDTYWMSKLNKIGKFETYDYAKSRMLSYSCVMTRRENNNWMAYVRGHSKFVYPFESWGPYYFAYPAFIANGYLDVSYPDHLDSTTPKEGTWQKGYDWHRWPGVTSVYVPYKQILTSPGQVKDEGGEYPFSDQAFCGGVETEDGNGVFVFPFKGHDMYGLQSFTGKKSYFFFDDFVVSLGTNIKSNIKGCQVETTILQNQISKDDKLITSIEDVTQFPYKKSWTKLKSFWMLDHRGTGYYIPEVPKGAELKLQHVNQINPQFQNKGEVSGDFSTVLFDHGLTPDNAAYEYAVVFNTDKADMKAFAADMKSKTKPYLVLQQTGKAHIVASPKNATTAYAIYDETAELPKGLVKAVNRPSTFVVKEGTDGIKLAVSDPDLNIYDGQDDLLPDGTRTEVSIYEHEWFYWPSRASKVQITLKGAWKIQKQIKEMETAKHKKARVISSEKGQTVLEFECRDGLSSEVLLTKAN